MPARPLGRRSRLANRLGRPEASWLPWRSLRGVIGGLAVPQGRLGAEQALRVSKRRPQVERFLPPRGAVSGGGVGRAAAGVCGPAREWRGPGPAAEGSRGNERGGGSLAAPLVFGGGVGGFARRRLLNLSFLSAGPCYHHAHFCAPNQQAGGSPFLPTLSRQFRR